MPGLAGIDEIAAAGHRTRQTRQRAQHGVVIGKQFIQSRHQRQIGRRGNGGQGFGIESIAGFKAGNIAESARSNQGTSGLHIGVAVVA